MGTVCQKCLCIVLSFKPNRPDSVKIVQKTRVTATQQFGLERRVLAREFFESAFHGFDCALLVLGVATAEVFFCKCVLGEA